MKLIFNSQAELFKKWAELFKKWAESIKPEDQHNYKCKAWGETHLFCEGPSVYSYGKHFELGRHVWLDGIHYVLLNQAKYSMTTTNHQWGANRETQKYNQLFVPDQSIMFNTIEEAFADSAKVNEVWAASVVPIAENLQNKRISTLHRYVSQMDAIKTKAEKYYSAYKLTIPDNILELFAVADSEDVKTRSAEHKAQQEKDQRCRAELYWLKRQKNKDNIDLKILSIAFMGEAKVKSLLKLPEDKIKELATRTGFNPEKPYGY